MRELINLFVRVGHVLFFLGFKISPQDKETIIHPLNDFIVECAFGGTWNQASSASADHPKKRVFLFDVCELDCYRDRYRLSQLWQTYVLGGMKSLHHQGGNKVPMEYTLKIWCLIDLVLYLLVLSYFACFNRNALLKIRWKFLWILYKILILETSPK